MSSRSALDALLESLLASESRFLAGIDGDSLGPSKLVAAVTAWVDRIGVGFGDVLRSIEPSLRQQVLFSLLPAKAFDSQYSGSYEAAIDEHANALGLTFSDKQRRVLLDLCINLNRLSGCTSAEARRRSFGIAQLRAHHDTYEAIMLRQGGRCYWCGVSLDSEDVSLSLDHITPKHIGDDPHDGSNWALTCSSCNHGKGDVLTWSTSAHAHNYIERRDLVEPNKLPLRQRWVVLARDKACSVCAKGPVEVELHVFRRKPTGLPVPSNCGTVCDACSRGDSLELVAPLWHGQEVGRAVVMEGV